MMISIIMLFYLIYFYVEFNKSQKKHEDVCVSDEQVRPQVEKTVEEGKRSKEETVPGGGESGGMRRKKEESQKSALCWWVGGWGEAQ